MEKLSLIVLCLFFISALCIESAKFSFSNPLISRTVERGLDYLSERFKGIPIPQINQTVHVPLVGGIIFLFLIFKMLQLLSLISNLALFLFQLLLLTFKNQTLLMSVLIISVLIFHVLFIMKQKFCFQFKIQFLLRFW